VLVYFLGSQEDLQEMRVSWSGVHGVSSDQSLEEVVAQCSSRSQEWEDLSLSKFVVKGQRYGENKLHFLAEE